MGIGALVGGALGVFGAVKSSSAQRKAADRAAQATENTSREQIALLRDINSQQRADLEPFRQQEIQRANALGEIFGFTPVGSQPPRQVATSAPGFAGGRFGSDIRFNPRTLYAQDERSMRGGRYELGGRFSPERFPMMDFGDRSGGMALSMQPNAIAPAQQPEPITMQSQQDAARERFEGSMFNDVYREGHARDVTRIDSGLASQGLAFSGARMQAVEDARADRFGSTFNSYMASLMGQAPTTATQSTNAAAGAFGAGATSAMGQAGAAQAQSAYAKGQASANMWGGLSGLGGYMMGGGFG